MMMMTVAVAFELKSDIDAVVIYYDCQVLYKALDAPTPSKINEILPHNHAVLVSFVVSDSGSTFVVIVVVASERCTS
jgi:hypothetical protein